MLNSTMLKNLILVPAANEVPEGIHNGNGGIPEEGPVAALVWGAPRVAYI